MKASPYWRGLEKGLHLGYYKGPRGGAWWVRWFDDGTYRKQRFAIADDNQDSNGDTVLNYGEAQRRALQLADEAKHPGALREPVTVAEAVEHYMQWYRVNRKSVNGTEATLRAHILPAFGSKMIADLTTGELKSWLSRLAAQPPRRRTRPGANQTYGSVPASADEKRARKASANRILTVLKAILNRAFDDELVSDDLPWRRVRPFKDADEPSTRFLITVEVERLMNACRSDFRPLVCAALYTGARYGELTRMRVEHINLDTGLVYVEPAKSGRGRHVPLSPEGFSFFEAHVVGNIGSSLAFVRADGKPWGKSHHTRPLAEACRIAKINPPIGFHDLRHTYASLLAQNDVDLLTISKLLGHADTRITSRHYAHLTDRTLASAVKKLPRFGFKVSGKVTAKPPRINPAIALKA